MLELKSESHISELKSLSNYLCELESELNTFWLITPAILCITQDGRFIKLNPAWEAITGYSIEHGLATPYKEFVHPDDLIDVKMAESNIDGGRKIINTILRYKHIKGYWIYLSWNAWQDEETKKVYATACDVTHTMRLINKLDGGNANGK